jgi:hypothetical protein
VRRAHSAFLKLCAARGLARDQYPFNSSTQALRSIYRFFKAVRESHFARSAALLGGRGAAKRSKLHSGYEPLLRHTEPYDAVQQDAHSLDVIGSIRIPHPKGSRRIPICRLALQAVIEVETKAILGYSVCLLGRISAQDALVAVQHALSKWKPLELDAPLISYPDGAGFPSGVIPELAGAAWATHYLDNDTAYTSELIAERIRNRIGCAVNWGPVGDWAPRPWPQFRAQPCAGNRYAPPEPVFAVRRPIHSTDGKPRLEAAYDGRLAPSSPGRNLLPVGSIPKYTPLRVPQDPSIIGIDGAQWRHGQATT